MFDSFTNHTIHLSYTVFPGGYQLLNFFSIGTGGVQEEGTVVKKLPTVKFLYVWTVFLMVSEQEFLALADHHTMKSRVNALQSSHFKLLDMEALTWYTGA